MPHLLTRTIASAALAVALLGVTACSDDDDGAAGDDQPAAESNGGGAASGLDESAGRPFGVDASGMATAMKAGAGADRVEVDGNTFRLYFDEGSKDDVTATVTCSAMDSVSGDDDLVVMVYPDGELDCAEALAARGG